MVQSTTKLNRQYTSKKTGYQVVENRAVIDFWGKYVNYQKEHHTNVWLLYNPGKRGSNASWPRYNTVIKGLYFNHKSEFGFIDLTFRNCANRITELEQMLFKQLGDYSAEGFSLQRTSKSAALRLIVPKLDFHESFESQIEDIKSVLQQFKK